MTIRHLRIFIEVADSGKMSLAAARLYISQPTVSQAVRELEEHYGVLLFERLSKKLHITESGKQLLQYARNVVDQFDALEESMVKKSSKQRLRVGATITVGTCLLSDLINEFESIQPYVNSYAYIGNTADIEEKLLNSELDIGIIEGTVKSPDLISIPIVDDFLVLACGNEHPLANKPVISPDDINHLDFVMREHGSGTRALFENYLRMHNLQINTKIEANCPEAMINAIIRNNCLACISVRLLKEEIQSGDVFIFCSSTNEWDRSFHLVYHKDKILTEAIRTISQLLHSYKKPDFLQMAKVGQLK